MILEATAHARWVRIAPRKMRLVADMVRGAAVRDAVNKLHFSVKRSSVPVEKAVRSALANLMQQEAGAKLDPGDVYIKEIKVDGGPTMRRWMPRAMGRAYRIRKRMSHVHILLAAEVPERETKAKVAAEAPKEGGKKG